MISTAARQSPTIPSPLSNTLPPAETPLARTFVTVYALAAGLGLLLFGGYKGVGTTMIGVASVGTLAIATGIVLTALSASLFVRACRRASNTTRRQLALVGATALLSLVIATLVGEASLRLLARESPTGVSIGRVELARTWPEERKRLTALLTAATPSGRWGEPYFAFDEYIGWTVGQNRLSADGLYASSVEGLRSRTRGQRLADRTPQHRVALVGDSYAFSLDVAFDESWGHQLEQRLGADVQVLNFGVDGFGIDQIMLRVERDVAPFHPDIVLFALNQHDIYRSMGVYAFIANPAWSMPFPKPRFVLNEENQLVHINPRLPTPHEIADFAAIEDLPHIELDAGFNRDSWSWRPDGAPYLYRLVSTLSPRYPKLDPAFAFSGIVRLNAALLRRLAVSSTAIGATLIGVYLPSRDTDERLAYATMAASGVAIEPMHVCLAAVPAERQRVVGGGNHFSGEANGRLADCSADLIRAALHVTWQTSNDSHTVAN